MNPRATQTVKDNTYIDHILDSVNIVKDDILANSEFEVKKWRSNEDLNKNSAKQEKEEIKVNSTGSVRAESTWSCVEQ